MEELITVVGNELTVPANISKEIRELIITTQKLEKRKKELQSQLDVAMAKCGITRLETEDFTAVVVTPTPRMKFNELKLKDKYPDIYEECQYETASSPYLRLTANLK